MFPCAVFGQDIAFDAELRAAYQHALNLQPEDAMINVPGDPSVEAAYIASLAETIELLVTEDQEKFREYEERFLTRVDKKLKGATRDYQFLQAEMRLQWAFVYLKFGHEFDAALRLRQAYEIAESCREKFPDYIPIHKTTGLLRVIVGSVPDKYNWVLSLLNMSGTVSGGLADLRRVSESGSPLAIEAQILHALVEGFLLAKPAPALEDMQEVLATEKGNRLALFLGASLAMKDAKTDVALDMLNQLTADRTGVPLYYADYLRGEAYLHKGEYIDAVAAFRWFVSHQTGHNYIKDAYYKMGLCYWLNGNENDALAMFEEAKKSGKESTEADKSAAHSLAQPDLPNVKLSKVRYLTDGGYYDKAEAVLSEITSRDLPVRRDQIEYYYRKARLAHKTGQPDAIRYYQEVIDMTGREHWYFAPNACLQLGYIYQSQNKIKEAEHYFQRALSYSRHEYKNSIDSKARSALAQLGRI